MSPQTLHGTADLLEIPFELESAVAATKDCVSGMWDCFHYWFILIFTSYVVTWVVKLMKMSRERICRNNWTHNDDTGEMANVIMFRYNNCSNVPYQRVPWKFYDFYPKIILWDYLHLWKYSLSETDQKITFTDEEYRGITSIHGKYILFTHLFTCIKANK